MQSGWSVSDSDGTVFTPMVVLELAEDTSEEAIKWLLGRIRDKEQNGGKLIAVLLLLWQRFTGEVEVNEMLLSHFNGRLLRVCYFTSAHATVLAWPAYLDITIS